MVLVEKPLKRPNKIYPLKSFSHGVFTTTSAAPSTLGLGLTEVPRLLLRALQAEK